MAPSNKKPDLSTAEILQMLVTAPWIILKVVMGALHQLVLRRNLSAAGVKRAFFVAIGRVVPLNLSIRQLRSLQPSTGNQLAAYCKAHNFDLQSVEPDIDPKWPPPSLHFVKVNNDVSSNRRVLLYAHGGGFIFPMSKGHAAFFADAAKQTSTELAFLEYTLSPEVKYPGHLAQCIACVRHLLGVRKFQPSEIIIGGDSAGGRIMLGLLKHLQTPNPVQASLSLGAQKFKGALIISPGCDLQPSSKSYRENEPIDILTYKSLQKYSAAVASEKPDEWNRISSSSTDAWKNLSASNVLITAGELEMFRDDIVLLAGSMGARAEPESDLRVAVVKDEIHAQPILDYALGITDGVTSHIIFDWLRSLS